MVQIKGTLETFKAPPIRESIRSAAARYAREQHLDELARRLGPEESDEEERARAEMIGWIDEEIAKDLKGG